MKISIITNPDKPSYTPGYGNLIFRVPNDVHANVSANSHSSPEKTVAMIRQELEALRAKYTAAYATAVTSDNTTVATVGAPPPNDLFQDSGMAMPRSITERSIFNLVALDGDGGAHINIDITSEAATHNLLYAPRSVLLDVLRDSFAVRYAAANSLGSQELTIVVPTQLVTEPTESPVPPTGTTTLRFTSMIDPNQWFPPADPPRLISYRNNTHEGTLELNQRQLAVFLTRIYQALESGFTQEEIITSIRRGVEAIRTQTLIGKIDFLFDFEIIRHPDWDNTQYRDQGQVLLDFSSGSHFTTSPFADQFPDYKNSAAAQQIPDHIFDSMREVAYKHIHFLGYSYAPDGTPTISAANTAALAENVAHFGANNAYRVLLEEVTQYAHERNLHNITGTVHFSLPHTLTGGKPKMALVPRLDIEDSHNDD